MASGTAEPLHGYPGYLDAKKGIDDRSLNQHVLGVLRRELVAERMPIQVLEIGAGIGTMVARLADSGVLAHADYTLLDMDRASLDEAPRWLQAWAADTRRIATSTPSEMRIRGGAPNVDLNLRFVCAELGEYLASHRAAAGSTLLIANAFLDLVDVPATLPQLFECITPGGLYWFGVNFDGETIFIPEHASDAELIGIYHRSMDERPRAGLRAGDSRSGRHLFQHLREAGARILAAGSSDWVVHAVDGRYPLKEDHFIEHILKTIEDELNRHPDVDPLHLQDWLRARRSQLAHGELTYIAHQLDFVGRRGA